MERTVNPATGPSCFLFVRPCMRPSRQPAGDLPACASARRCRTAAPQPLGCAVIDYGAAMCLSKVEVDVSRRFWIALSAVAVVVKGADILGLSQIASGPDLGVRWSGTQQNGQSALVLSNDAGDVKGWVRLIFDRAVPAQTLQAALSDGTQLRAASPTPGADQSVIDIVAASPPATPGAQQFIWPTGATLSVVAMNIPALRDWVVFTADKGSDSSVKMRRRQLWYAGSWVLLIVAVVGAFLTATGEGPQPPITAAACVTGIIASLAADKPIKTFLTKVLIEKAGINEALDAVGVGKLGRRQRIAFVFRAQSVFKIRLNNLIGDLAGYRVYLQ
jgi:hypothetical protein